MSRQTITEREVAAGLAEALNRHIAQGGLPFDQASVERKGDARYPDIVVWTDYAAQKPFALWELKAPGKKEDLSVLPEKAAALEVRYVVVWDFQNGELYEVEGRQLQSRKPYPVPLLRSLGEWGDPFKRAQVEEQARKILDDLAQLAQGESLTPYVPDKFYFIGILQEAVRHLVPGLKERIFHEKKKRDVRRRLDEWAVQQGYRTDLTDLDDILARHWAYSLAVRVLFYFTIRRYYPGLPDLCPTPGSAQGFSDLLWDAFSRAQAVDWQAVFERSPLDELGLPPVAEDVLSDLLDGFHRYDFGQLKEDVIGQIMEGLIPPEERHALGQYFTREDLVDFILGFVADDWEKSYLDPTCGSGTFLNRLYSRLRWQSGYRTTHAHLLNRLWGVDIAHFPAELATINLFRQDVRDLNNFPRIIVQDFFQIRPGQTFAFPPPRVIAPDYPKIQLEMPAFHGIVGNFPYIRQELIERQSPGYKRAIVQAIAREWFWKDPDLFQFKGVAKAELANVLQEGPEKHRNLLEQWLQKGRVDLRLSGQADIYAYLFYHAAAFLEEGGRLGIVTSNAWLDVAYGVELKRFFLRHFKIIAVVASWAEPWFEDAAINTAFIVLERCSDAEARRRNVVRFVKVKKPLSELLPRDLLLREAERWRKVDALVRQIESADAQVTRWDPTTGQVQPLQGVHTVETDGFRIRLVPQGELATELERKGETAKWGLYIRAPQVYFDLLEAVGDKLVPLSQVAEVRRGYTTGINDFFYLKPLDEPAETPGAIRVKNGRGWIGEIEEACLRPVIKSPKEAKGLVVDPAALEYRLFMPPVGDEEDPEQALRQAYPLAWQYVEWGARQRTREGQLWPEVPSVQGRRAWWLLPEKVSGLILMPMINDKRFAIFDNEQRASVDHNLFEFLIPAERAKLCLSLMNSTLFALSREVVSRVNLGDGATKTEGMDWKSSVLMPDPSKIEPQKQKRIIRAYQLLRERSVQPIAQEVKQKDRRMLDEAVLEGLGLDPKEYLPRIYEGLVEMVQERLALPRMRATRREQARRMSLEQIKEKVRKEVLPSGLKTIIAFLPTRPKPEMMSVPVSGRPIGWQSFITQHTLLDDSGNEVGTLVGGETQARYAVYAWAPDRCMLEVPADPIVAGKAVQEYEQYLRQTGEEMFQRLLEATRDYRQAMRAAREILEFLSLPPPAICRALGD